MKENKPTKKEQLEFAFSLIGGGVTSFIFYKVYKFIVEALGSSFDWIGILLTTFMFLVGMGLGNVIINGINKINKKE